MATTKEEVIESLKPLLAEARAKSCMLVPIPATGEMFLPSELEAANVLGKYCWRPNLWYLVSIATVEKQLVDDVKRVQGKLDAFREKVRLCQQS